MKLKMIHEEMTIRASRQRLWQILQRYGDVSHFHAGVRHSQRVGTSDNLAAPGCERECHIVDMGLHITLKERIIDYQEGKSYTYEVYEWHNFPLARMELGFTLLDPAGPLLNENETVLAIDIAFKARPALLTPLLAGKMRRLARNVLLGYKHYAETGEQRAPLKTLQRRYSAPGSSEVNYG